ncbi:uncharacterized protein N0V89_008182 [Didymosphaeria variabile]|uniref:Uncharacterized protein n=1 Tax=Didymosphaeria variabile TaxID=1932322 RepID=A0A9W9C899_9PLEO|nr:uncharacterized protein N0V89_008182 [Didymosphaeria variabile]KAJ4349566.1 hypothetical protein N0V89_008182 [Didymosphaeria variabile]
MAVKAIGAEKLMPVQTLAGPAIGGAATAFSKNIMDIFEPDARDATCGGEPSSTVCGFVAVEAPASSVVSEQAPATASTHASSAQQIDVIKATSSISTQTSYDLYAGDIYLGSSADLARAQSNETAKDETTSEATDTSHHESAATLEEPATTVQEPVAVAQESAALVQQSATTAQTSVAQETPESTLPSQSTSSEASKSSSPSSTASSGSSIQQILDAIPFSDYHPDRSIMALRDGELFFQNGVEEAGKAKDGMFDGATELNWKIGLRKILISSAIREKENNDWNEATRLSWAFPAGVVHSKNGMDPRICDDLQGSPAKLDTQADLQDAIEAWRDTVDGWADGYGSTIGEPEDFDGIDNNAYHDYFPDVPRKVVYHSTAVQTQMITTPLLYEKMYGREPTKVELRQILRTIGAPEYVDQSELWYGKPFLKSSGSYPDVQAETQDSGFQAMDFEIREANILKAKAKAGITATKLNKLSLERQNGIRVYGEPSNDSIVHSQQFTALRAIVDKAGTVQSYGSFTPMIHNVVYEVIAEKPVTTVAKASSTVTKTSSTVAKTSSTVAKASSTVAKAPSTTLAPSAPPQSSTSKAKVENPKMISSYCRSPSPGPYDEAQIKDPEMFENGWPSNMFPLQEVDGTYSEDVIKDFVIPDPGRFHKTVPQHAPTAVDPAKSATGTSVPVLKQKKHDISVANASPRAPATVQEPSITQKKHDIPVANEAPRDPISVQKPSITQQIPHTPSQQEGQGESKKRSVGELSDEGYKSHSSWSASKRQKHAENTAAASSHFSTPYDTPLSSDDLKVATATPTASDPLKIATATSNASSKRKRDASPLKESADATEQPNSKRLKALPTPTPITRRLPPTEATLKVIPPPKGMLKIKTAVNQKKALHTGRPTTQKAPIGNSDRKPEKTQQQESVREIQQPPQHPPVVESSLAPATPSRPGWANRKPTSNRDKKENPNRWRNGLGAVGLGSRYEPYNAGNRGSRRN